MSTLTCKVDSQGRVVLPEEWRKRFHVGPSTELIIREQDNGALSVETPQQGLLRAQELIGRYIKPDDPSLVDELLEDRRREASGE